MLQIIVLSVFTGIGIVSVGERADTLLKTLDGITEVCYKIVHYIMQLAPIGVFGLICPVVAANGPNFALNETCSMPMRSRRSSVQKTWASPFS